jgi:hypothetical protein
MKKLIFVVLLIIGCIGLVGCATTTTTAPVVPAVADQCTTAAQSIFKDAVACPGSLRVLRTDGSTVCMTPADAATLKAKCPTFN